MLLNDEVISDTGFGLTDASLRPFGNPGPAADDASDAQGQLSSFTSPAEIASGLTILHGRPVSSV